MKKAILLTAALACSGCSGADTKVNAAEFVSLDRCLSVIKRTTGQTIKRTAKDTPDEVSGTLTGGYGFWCKKKVTGTKGTYFEGAYYDL